MDSNTNDRLIKAALLVAAIYVFARVAGITGPGSHIQFDDRVMTIGIIAISIWGLMRLLRART